MPVGSLSVDDAISLLGHEQAERETEVGLKQRLSQSVGRLLGVSNLAEVSSLYRWTKIIEAVSLTYFLANLRTQAQCGKYCMRLCVRVCRPMHQRLLEDVSLSLFLSPSPQP